MDFAKAGAPLRVVKGDRGWLWLCTLHGPGALCAVGRAESQPQALAWGLRHVEFVHVHERNHVFVVRCASHDGCGVCGRSREAHYRALVFAVARDAPRV